MEPPLDLDAGDRSELIRLLAECREALRSRDGALARLIQERSIHQAELEAGYRALMETAGDGIWVLDEQGRLLAVNDAYCRRSGYSREELLAMRIAELEAQEDPEEVLRHIAQVKRHGNDRFETLHRAKDGTVWPAEISVSYWPSAGGRFFCFSRDISDRRRAEEALRESEARFRSIFLHSPDAIYVVQDDRIVSINRACQRLFGAERPEDLLGRSSLELVHPDLKPLVAERIRRVRELGEAVPPMEERVRRLDGTWAQVEVAAAPFPIGGNAAAQVILRDIAERKSLERQIIEAGAAEQERIGRDIHDGVGQQLTGIAMLAAGIQRQLVAEGRQEQANSVAELGAHLKSALDEVRSLARGLSPVDIDIQGLPGALAELAERVGETSGVPCRFLSRGTPRGDDPTLAVHLYRIAQEALQNAVRHARSGRMEIGLEFAPEGVTLKVRDYGQGIGRGPAPAGGMGLKIMRYRAGMVGGRLSIGTAAGGGTLVRCEVPAARGPTEPPKYEPAGAPPAGC